MHDLLCMTVAVMLFTVCCSQLSDLAVRIIVVEKREFFAFAPLLALYRSLIVLCLEMLSHPKYLV